MAADHGWVRRRLESQKPVLQIEHISDVFVPSPGQEVGSGAHPSQRDPKMLSEIMEMVLSSRGWSSQLEVGSLINRWESLVGPAIAQNCWIEEFSDDGILTLRTRTTSWHTQIRALLAMLDKKIATEIGEGVVKKIVVNGPHVRSWKHGRYSVPGRGPRDTYD
ncbi:DUF721 domain-containing protein [Trueperella sp. LYQ143]|uniref:DUF721 domain-containing protein n=1 Tax=unclassified Trueperella TaxID=2630174 RepID=UPI003982F3B9